MTKSVHLLTRIVNRLPKSGRGAALVVVFLILTLLASAIIALLQITVTNAASVDNSRNRYQALLLAQAGLNHAICEINAGKALNGSHEIGSPKTTWGTQQGYAVTTIANADGTKTITSVGTYYYTDDTAGTNPYTAYGMGTGSSSTTQVQRKLQAVIAPPTNAGRFTVGGFGKSSVTLTGVAQTDSYDSSLVTASGNPISYAQQVAAVGDIVTYDKKVGAGGNVASNGPITGSGNIVVHGSATPGPGQSVSLSGGATVTGSTASASSPFSTPSYSYKPPLGGSASFSTNNDTTITAGTYHFSDWKQTGGTVTFGAGVTNVYLDGNLKQSGQGAINLAPGATVNFYQGSGSFDLSGQGLINLNTVPSTFNIVSASSSNVNLTGQGDIYATLYAPDASVKIAGKGQLFGAVIGNDLTLNGLGEFHYDKAATSPGIQSNVVVLSTWEVDI